MIRLELTTEDARILYDALQSYVSDLRMEIANTDAYDFRQSLKQREEVLRRIMEQLRMVQP
ncbi:hypothetical protein [Kallotenue papyrolyticum]|uniref:hypothetical protein n=1 Tax=Kallotenue papyrolyticum TaxID=1325125 RepID=UPI000492588B|nr:hypothetical protein [Kallotenue papyrolyticum]